MYVCVCTPAPAVAVDSLALWQWTRGLVDSLAVDGWSTRTKLSIWCLFIVLYCMFDHQTVVIGFSVSRWLVILRVGMFAFELWLVLQVWCVVKYCATLLTYVSNLHIIISPNQL